MVSYEGVEGVDVDVDVDSHTENYRYLRYLSITYNHLHIFNYSL